MPGGVFRVGMGCGRTAQEALASEICDDAPMSWLPVLDEAFRTRLLAQDDASCRRWLEDVPALCEEVARRWRLEQSGPPSFGGASIVVPVTTQSGRPAALKLVSPLGDAQAEHRALSALAGRGVVAVHDVDPERSALLLEHLVGPTLAEQAGQMGLHEAAGVAGEVAGAIASVPAPRDAPQLADGTEQWLVQLRTQHATALRLGSALPEEMFAAAVDCARSLRSVRSVTLTHGDLSFANIMRRAGEAWVAIDPSYLAGPRENESHTVLRSMLGPIMGSSDPTASMAALHHRFCEAADADEDLALDISFARFAASYYWEPQHQGDPANVANLLAGTHCAAEVRH